MLRHKHRDQQANTPCPVFHGFFGSVTTTVSGAVGSVTSVFCGGCLAGSFENGTCAWHQMAVV